MHVRSGVGRAADMQAAAMSRELICELLRLQELPSHRVNVYDRISVLKIASDVPASLV